MNRPRLNVSQNFISTQIREDYFNTNFSQISQDQQNSQEDLTHNNQFMAIESSSFKREEEIKNYIKNSSESHKKRQQQEYINQIRNQYNLLTDPVLKIKSYKMNSLTNEKEFISEHYITPYGLIGTIRNISDYCVKIGRLQNDENGMPQNDLILPSDRSISRCHCRIEYSDGFKYVRKLPDEYIALLMMNHPRLGSEINVPHMPHHLLYNILSYLHNKREFYLIDCGSILGTYIKLRFNERNYLNRTQIYAIGSEYLIIIKEIYLCDAYPKLFMDYINDQRRSGVIILGLSDEYNELTTNTTPQQRNLINFKFPSKTCLKIDISNINPNEPCRS